MNALRLRDERKLQESVIRRADLEARERLETVARAQAEEHARLRAEHEARLKTEQQARLRIEEEARLKAEEQSRVPAPEEATLFSVEGTCLELEEPAEWLAEVEPLTLAAEEHAACSDSEQAGTSAGPETTPTVEAPAIAAETPAQPCAEEGACVEVDRPAQLFAEQEAPPGAEQLAPIQAWEEGRLRAEEQAEADAREAAPTAGERARTCIEDPNRDARLLEALEMAPVFLCAWISNGDGNVLAKADRTWGGPAKEARLRDWLLGLTSAHERNGLKRVFLEDEMGTAALVPLPGDRYLIAVAETAAPLGSVSVGIGKLATRLTQAGI